MTWTIQGLWVLMTAGMAFAALSSKNKLGLDLFVIGALIWLLGFVIEVVSDKQKTNFKNNPSNEGGRFIQEGLWSWSRHPNYFGEIVLWIGIAVIAYPVIEGWQYFALCLLFLSFSQLK